MNPAAAVRSAQPSTFSLAAYEIHGSVFSGRAENMSQRTPYTSLHSHQLTQNTFASQLTMAVGDVSHGGCCPTSILHLPLFFWAEQHMFFVMLYDDAIAQLWWALADLFPLVPLDFLWNLNWSIKGWTCRLILQMFMNTLIFLLCASLQFCSVDINVNGNPPSPAWIW